MWRVFFFCIENFTHSPHETQSYLFLHFTLFNISNVFFYFVSFLCCCCCFVGTFHSATHVDWSVECAHTHFNATRAPVQTFNALQSVRNFRVSILTVFFSIFFFLFLFRFPFVLLSFQWIFSLSAALIVHTKISNQKQLNQLSAFECSLVFSFSIFFDQNREFVFIFVILTFFVFIFFNFR